jgi:hypothetical protein
MLMLGIAMLGTGGRLDRGPPVVVGAPPAHAATKAAMAKAEMTVTLIDMGIPQVRNVGD